MSYQDQKTEIHFAAAATANDIVTPADPIATVVIQPGFQPIRVSHIWARIVTANTVAPTILTFKKRITIGSATGESVIGTLTIPIGAAIANVYWKSVDGVIIYPGQEIVVQTDGGGTAGTAVLGVHTDPAWEHPSNRTNMVQSV